MAELAIRKKSKDLPKPTQTGPKLEPSALWVQNFRTGGVSNRSKALERALPWSEVPWSLRIEMQPAGKVISFVPHVAQSAQERAPLPSGWALKRDKGGLSFQRHPRRALAKRASEVSCSARNRFTGPVEFEDPSRAN
jgi:hypothetical protein